MTCFISTWIGCTNLLILTNQSILSARFLSPLLHGHSSSQRSSWVCVPICEAGLWITLDPIFSTILILRRRLIPSWIFLQHIVIIVTLWNITPVRVSRCGKYIKGKKMTPWEVELNFLWKFWISQSLSLSAKLWTTSTASEQSLQFIRAEFNMGHLKSDFVRGKSKARNGLLSQDRGYIVKRVIRSYLQCRRRVGNKTRKFLMKITFVSLVLA